MNRMLVALIEYLRARREGLVRSVEVLEPRFCITFPPTHPATISMDIVDFDQLLGTIDEFAATFKEQDK